MPRRRPDSALLREGSRSYRGALLALRQFRTEVQKAIRAAIKEQRSEIAGAMKLDKIEFSDGLVPHVSPEKLTQNRDGAEAFVGLKYPGREDATGWGVYFGFTGVDGKSSYVEATFRLKQPGSSIKTLEALGIQELGSDDFRAWILERVTDKPDGFSTAVRKVLTRWIALWQKAGGLKQFLPDQKGRRTKTSRSPVPNAAG